MDPLVRPKSFFLSPEIHDYLLRHSSPLDSVQRELIAETRSLGAVAAMQIAPEQGIFLTLLARAIRAKRVLEVGTFTGYSTLCLARGLPSDGKVLTCDVSEEWTAIARRFWERAGVAKRIELRIGPASETLRGLAEQPPFDLIFIDADKPGYRLYYEEGLRRLRSNGLIVIDNLLWSGRVADPSADDPNLRALRAFNAHLARDERVDRVILPIADGLGLARKR